MVVFLDKAILIIEKVIGCMDEAFDDLIDVCTQLLYWTIVAGNSSTSMDIKDDLILYILSLHLLYYNSHTLGFYAWHLLTI